MTSLESNFLRRLAKWGRHSPVEVPQEYYCYCYNLYMCSWIVTKSRRSIMGLVPGSKLFLLGRELDATECKILRVTRISDVLCRTSEVHKGNTLNIQIDSATKIDYTRRPTYFCPLLELNRPLTLGKALFYDLAPTLAGYPHDRNTILLADGSAKALLSQLEPLLSLSDENAT
jgi:hypothetical protein